MKRLFGGNGGKREGPGATQEHVPVAMVKHDVIVSKPFGAGGRVVTAVLRVGSQDVLRMGDGERTDFLDRYGAAIARWQFPRQVLVWRERQDPAEFLARMTDQAQSWRDGDRRAWGEHLDEMQAWMQRVTAQVNPQVPSYYIALPHGVARVLGQSLEQALEELESRCDTVIHSLASLGIGCVRLGDDELLEMLAAFYHPTLPMLRIPPVQRLRSLVAGEWDEVAGGGESWTS